MDLAGKGEEDDNSDRSTSVSSQYNAYNSAKRNKEYYDKKVREAKTDAEKARYQALADQAQATMDANVEDDPVSPYSEGQMALRRAQRYQEQVLAAAENPLERVVTQAALSAGGMAPALLAAPLTGGSGTLAIMAAQAAGGKAGELSARGVSAQEALLRGAASGAIEAVTEKVPVSNLLNIIKGSGGATFLKNIARQAGIEATEESASYALNYAADKAARDPEATFSLEDLINSAAVGAVSGAGFGSVGSAIGSVRAPVSGSNTRATTTLDANNNPLIQTTREANLNNSRQQATEAVQKAQESLRQAAESSNTSAQETSFQPQETPTEEVSLEQRKADYNARYADWQNRVRQAQSTGDTNAISQLQREIESLNQEAAQIEQEERISSGQVSANFNAEENHIDQRDASSVKSKNVKAFQFDHPELHPYYVEAAQALAEDAEYSLYTQRAQKGQGTVVKRSEALEKAESYGLSRQEVVKVCEDIIADKGQENYAAAKRVEMVLDDMLSNGYVPNEALGNPDARVPANEAYIRAKENISGAIKQDSFEAYKRDSALALELGEVTEDQLRQEWEASQVQNANDLPEGMGAMSSGGAGAFDAWQSTTPESGFHPINERAAAVTAEEQGRAPIEVPTRDQSGMLTSKTASTLLNANITPNQFTVELEDALARGDFSRMAYSDNRATNRAEMTIREKGFQRAKEDWLSDVRNGKMGKDITALGITLYNNAVNSGSTVEALDIASEMVSYGKSVGQSLQAFNIINKMTPSGQLYAMAKTAENLDNQVKQNAKIDPETGLPQYEGVEIDPDLAKQFLEAETDAERENIRQEIYRDIASQVPATWKDKFNAWRYLAMLGNPRTHIRNILGNAGFMPVRMTKNAIAASIEKVAGVKSRTKSSLNLASKEDRALLQAGWNDFLNVESTIKNEGKWDDMENQIDKYRTIFKTKPLEAARKANSTLLDKEDMWFSRPAYAGALAGYLKANKVTAADFMGDRISTEAKSAAQEYAIKEAQKATYRDSNALSDFVSSASRLRNSKNPVAKGASYLLEGVLPFKKTPANIALRGVEYSPVGLLKGLTYDLSQVKKGNMGAAEAIDNIAAGFTGTGLVALGAFLASQGLVSGGGSGDDNQDQFDDLQGMQNYALNIGDTNFTLDWLAPEALPFFVGVELFDNIADGTSSEEGPFADAMDALGRIADPMLEMSMLQSLNDLIDNVRYSDNSMGALAANALTSYLSQFLPTLGGQIERTFLEDTRQSTYVDRNSWVPKEIQLLLGQWGNKIPGIDYNQQDYIDAWGRTESTGDNVLLRAFNNFINPSYVSQRNTGDLETELQRLYDAGYEGVFPSRLKTSTKLDDKYLTADQYSAYATTKGQESRTMLEGIITSPQYQALSDAEKANIVKKVYEFGTFSGKAAAGANTEEFDSWYGNLIEGRDKHGISPTDYLTMYLGKNTINKDETMDNTQKGLTVASMIDSNPNLNDDQKKYLKDKLKIYNMFPVDTGEDSKYQQAINAGFTPEEAAENYKIVSEAKKYGEDSTLDESEFERYMKEKMGIEKGTPEYNKYLAAYGSKSWKSVKALIGDQTSSGHNGYTMSDERYSAAVNAGFDEATSKNLAIGRQVADSEFGNGNGTLSKSELTAYIKANYPQDQWKSVFSVVGNKNWKNPFG